MKTIKLNQVAIKHADGLSFLVLNGLIAGHDVGFSYKDFHEDCLKLDTEAKIAVKQMCKRVIAENCDGHICRVDGTNRHDMSDTEWAKYQYKCLLRCINDNLLAVD